jgi:hypothetical protein
MIMIRIALSVLLVAFFAVGCRNKSAASRKEGSDASQALEFSSLWPQEEVAKLTPEQRARLLDLALVGLQGNNWQHALDVLISLGSDSVPGLIAMVESKEPTAASKGPVPSAKVKSLGELAHDTLLLIVQNRSSYKGEMPARSQDAWQRWWADHSAQVVVKG